MADEFSLLVALVLFFFVFSAIVGFSDHREEGWIFRAAGIALIITALGQIFVRIMEPVRRWLWAHIPW